MAAAKKGIDLAVVLGGGDRGPPAKAKPSAMGDSEAEEAEDELPAGFSAAAEEFLDAERPLEERVSALHRAIKACGEYAG